MIVNGYNVCGHDWPSSWCNHQCGRAVGHAAEGGHWCGFCGNPQLPPGVSLRERAELSNAYDHPPADFREIDGSPGPDGLADAADDLLESSGAEPSTMDATFRIGCPACRGRSPTVEQMNWQLERGDTSGACSTCNNTHWIAAPRADWTLAGGGTECPECHGGGFTGRGTGYDDVCSFCGGGGRVRAEGDDDVPDGRIQMPLHVIEYDLNFSHLGFTYRNPGNGVPFLLASRSARRVNVELLGPTGNFCVLTISAGGRGIGELFGIGQISLSRSPSDEPVIGMFSNGTPDTTVRVDEVRLGNPPLMSIADAVAEARRIMGERMRRKALLWIDRDLLCGGGGGRHISRMPRWCEHDECHNGVDYEDRLTKAGTVVHYPAYVHWPICRADAVAARTKLERFRRRAWMRLQRPSDAADARRGMTDFMFARFCALTCTGGSEAKLCPCDTPDGCMMRAHPLWQTEGLRPSYAFRSIPFRVASEETDERPF